jgi:hypothetical protein
MPLVAGNDAYRSLYDGPLLGVEENNCLICSLAAGEDFTANGFAAAEASPADWLGVPGTA